MFWSKETVNEWKQAISKDNAGTERLQNIICASPTTHVLHKKGFKHLNQSAKIQQGCPYS